MTNDILHPSQLLSVFQGSFSWLYVWTNMLCTIINSIHTHNYYFVFVLLVSMNYNVIGWFGHQTEVFIFNLISCLLMQVVLPIINYVSLSIFNHIEQVFGYFHSLSYMLLTTRNYCWKDYTWFSIISYAGRSCFNCIYVMLKIPIKCCTISMGCELLWHLILRRLLTIYVRYHCRTLFYVLKFYSLCT